MSEEQRKDEETEVEAHGSGFKVDHPKVLANDEPSEDDEVEAHGSGFKVDHPKTL